MNLSFEAKLGSYTLEQRLLEISHFVHLFIDEIAIYKITNKQIKASEKARIEYNKYRGRYEVKFSFKNKGINRIKVSKQQKR